MGAENDNEILQLLRNAQTCFLDGAQDAYDARLAEARTLVEAAGTPDALYGEWLLISWLGHFRDLDKGVETLRKVKALLPGRSRVMDASFPLTAAGDNISVLYWNARGGLDAAYDKYKMLLPLYTDITGGGMGFDEVFASEIAYNRMDFEQAALHANKAVYIGRNTQQNLLTACGARMLAQIAKHRIDVEGWKYAIRMMDKAAADDPTHYVSRLVENVKNLLMTSLFDCASLPEWLRDGDFPIAAANGTFGMRFRCANDRVQYAGYIETLWTHIMYLLFTGQFERALAADTIQHMAGVEEAFFEMGVYCKQARAISLFGLHDVEGARRELYSAISDVAQDGCWLMVGELAPFTGSLVREIMSEHWPEELEHVLHLSNEFGDKLKRIREAVRGKQDLMMLTAREREIALLAATGIRNAKIAEKLNITDKTVKFHLTNIYQKLEIDGRNQLIAVLHQ